ncbi:MAG: nucleoside phosphorylase [Flavobacteriales bacterium]|nr:nucleoside phosphorylase [Flavobacteriales bacterium]
MKARRSLSDRIPESQLILQPSGAVYHLGVTGDQIADTVLIVGDPDRVPVISKRFDSIQHKVAGREFVIHTGRIGKKEITVLSSGIGVDNIDIVINELDAAVNIDPKTRLPRSKKRILRLIRLGTTGALQKDIPVGTRIASAYAIGYDGVPWHYDVSMLADEERIAKAFIEHTNWPQELASPYVAKADKVLLHTIGEGMVHGITVTANGFYGPQNRALRVPLRDAERMDQMRSFQTSEHRLTNFEMECAGIYALGSMLSHRVLTCCVVLANRYNEEFTTDPAKAVESLIDAVLGRL